MGYFKWADQQLQDLIAKNPTYERSKYPGMMLGMANQAFNAQMPGSQQFQQNMFSNQANTNAAIGRSATDASQALSAYAGSQGQTANDIIGLQMQQADWKKFGLGQLNDAYGVMANEDRYANEMEQQKYQNEVSLRGAQAANKMAKRKALWNTVGGIAQLGVAAFTGGASSAASGIGGMFRGGSGGGDQSVVNQNQFGGYSP